MAYGLKYELIFDDIYQSITTNPKPVYRVRIYLDGYTSSTVYPLIGASSPVSIESIDSKGKSYSPIISKRAIINLVVDSNLNIQEFFDANYDDFKIVIEKGTKTSTYTWASTLFVGLFVPVEQIILSPIQISTISLVFNDGLANLKEFKIYYDNLFIIAYNAGETYSFKDILTNAFGTNSLGLNFNVNWYYKNTGIPDRELENIYIEKNTFVKNPSDYLIWYDVLEGICRKFGFICYQKNGEYYLTSYGSLTRTTSRSYYKYNYLGAYQSTITETDSYTTIDATNNFKQVDTSLQLSLSKGNKSYTQSSNVQNSIQSVLNGDFSSWATSTSVDAWSSSVAYARNGTNNELRITSSQSIGIGYGGYLQSQAIISRNGDVISVFSDMSSSGLYSCYGMVILVPTDTTLPNYYLQADGTFYDTIYYVTPSDFSSGGMSKYTYIPCDGNIFARFYQPYYSGGTIPGLYVRIGYFRIQYFGVNSNVQNFNAVVNEAARDSLFNRDNEAYTDLTFFADSGLINTIQSTITFNNKVNVAASRFLGAWLTSGRSSVIDLWQRDGTGDITSLFNLVSDDIGTDELYNQLKIEGSFLSIGYDIISKFSYNYDGGTGHNSNYILIGFKWDLKNSTQTVNLYAINYGRAINITKNLYLNSK